MPALKFWDGTAWQYMGTAGPEGPQGDPGPPGPQGPQGDASAAVNPLIGATPTEVVLSTLVQGQAQQRYQLTAGGTINIGTGSNTPGKVLDFGGNNVLIGPGTTGPATGVYNVVLGAFARTSADVSSGVAVGQNATIGGASGVAIGNNANAATVNDTALGRSSETGGSWSTAVGYSANAYGAQSLAMGQSAYTPSTGTYATAIGGNATARGAGSVAIGCDSTRRGANTTIQDQAVIGTVLTQTKVAGLTTAFVSTPNDLVLTRAHHTVITTGPVTITMPAPASCGAGAEFCVINQSTGTTTINPSAGEAIQGQPTLRLTTRSVAQLMTDGSDWYVVNGWMPAQPQPTNLQALVWGASGWGPQNIVNQLTAGNGVGLSARTGTNCTITAYPTVTKAVLSADTQVPGNGADFSVYSFALPIYGGAYFFVSTVTILNNGPDSAVSLFLSTTASFGGEFACTSLTAWGQAWSSASIVGYWAPGSGSRINLTCLSEQPITIRASDRWGLPNATQMEAIRCF